MTAKVINPILSSVIETFRSMLGVSVQRRDLRLRGVNDSLNDITALIGISGRVKGSVCLSFQAETALGVVEKVLGERPTEVNSDVIDALGEVANIVGGAAKSKLNMGLNIGLPNVVHGSDYVVEFPTESRPMRLDFDSELGPFFVEFGFVVRQL
jgi:chemotaxis protein CheX